MVGNLQNVRKQDIGENRQSGKQHKENKILN